MILYRLNWRELTACRHWIERPLKPITRVSDGLFENVTVTLKDWHLPYAEKHHYKMHFDLKHRTFQVATAATRETWYIVMHPIVAPVLELDASLRKRLERQAKSSRSSALVIHHAQAMASHIKHVFLSGELFGERVEASWGLNSMLSQKLTCNKWTTFQERFMESWLEHVPGNRMTPSGLRTIWCSTHMIMEPALRLRSAMGCRA